MKTISIVHVRTIQIDHLGANLTSKARTFCRWKHLFLLSRTRHLIRLY